MDWFASIISSLNNILWSYILIGLLICVGLWFTFCTRFVQITNVREMFRCVLEGSRTPRPEGHISPFQAFCISTASRVGVGNIAGIAIAVVTGGPGAIFWMWVIATLGAASGFIESTLAQIYKVKKPGGGFMGGPAYYIKNALGSPFWAGVFAVLISVTYALIFNSVQANTISLSIETTTGLKPAYTGLILAMVTGLVIFGGMTRIAKVASFMVPFMAGAYLLLAFVVTCMNITEVPRVLLMIVTKAFSFDSITGAAIGVALMTGIKRGLFSNEAGMGAVPNAAAAADASHPVKQGLIQAMGVYFDTLFVCTASAMLVLLSPEWMMGSKLTGIALVQKSVAGRSARRVDKLLYDRHCAVLCFQLHHRQLLLRRNEHAFHFQKQIRHADLPSICRCDGLCRLDRFPFTRLGHGRPVHSLDGYRELGRHSHARQIRYCRFT